MQAWTFFLLFFSVSTLERKKASIEQTKAYEGPTPLHHLANYQNVVAKPRNAPPALPALAVMFCPSSSSAARLLPCPHFPCTCHAARRLVDQRSVSGILLSFAHSSGGF